MSRCQRKMVPGVTISRNAARRSAGTVPASSASNARSGHVNRALVPAGEGVDAPDAVVALAHLRWPSPRAF
jgi:hypothetical protein